MPEPDDFDETLKWNRETYGEATRLSNHVRERGALLNDRDAEIVRLREWVEKHHRQDGRDWPTHRCLECGQLPEKLSGFLIGYSREGGHKDDCSVPSLLSPSPQRSRDVSAATHRKPYTPLAKCRCGHILIAHYPSQSRKWMPCLRCDCTDYAQGTYPAPSPQGASEK